MKQLYFLFFFLASSLFVQGQSTTLWSPHGWNSSGGFVKYNLADSTTKTAFSFERNESTYYTKGKFVEANNGNLYAFSEGLSSSATTGSVLELNPKTGVQRLIYPFSLISFRQWRPRGSLIQASNGKLYGTTSLGGLSNNRGAIVSIDFNIDTLLVEAEFANINTFGPTAEIIQTANGKIYGAVTTGGANNRGGIFEFDPQTKNLQFVYDFNPPNSFAVIGSFIEVAPNKLIGASVNGGANNKGALFEYDIQSSSFSILVDLDSSTGSFPEGGPIQAADGSYYLMGQREGANNHGTIIKYNPVLDSITKVIDLDSASTGKTPTGDLLEGKNGWLYFTCREGGFENDGTIMKYNPSNDSLVSVHRFNTIDGRFPRGSLLEASDGNLYGTTTQGGLGDRGTTFKINMPEERHQKLNDGDWYNDGYAISGPLVQGEDGWLYGTTIQAGNNSAGIICRIDPYEEVDVQVLLKNQQELHIYQKLHDFDTLNGLNPYGALAKVDRGLLIGSTVFGGLHGDGTIFTYDYINEKFESVFDFLDSVNGTVPSGSMVKADDGFIYGTLESSGTQGKGAIFQFDLKNRSLSIVHSLDGPNGERFDYGLMKANNGLLYGITADGGQNNEGVILSFDPQTQQAQKLADFGGNNGNNPVGTLLQASDGNLYGLTTAGGLNNAGMLYRYNLSTNQLDTLHSLTNQEGRESYSSLTEVNGLLYGVCRRGGPLNRGSYFSYDMASSQFALLPVNFQNMPNEPTWGVVAIDSCRKSFLAGLNYPKDTLCNGDTLEIEVGNNSQLNFSTAWDLYADKNGSPIQSNQKGVFKLTDFVSGTYYLGVSGGCEGVKILDSLNIRYTIIDTAVTVNRPTLEANDTTATYQWLDCNNGFSPIANATDRIFTPLVDGLYAVELTKKNCIDTSACKQIIGIGIKENALKNSISLSPNPTTGQIQLTFQKEEEYQLIIRNIQGKELQRLQLTNVQTKTLEIEGPKGIYFVEVQNEKGERASWRVVKL